jgi:hypothetical protein
MKNLKNLQFLLLLFVSTNLFAQEYRPIRNVDTTSNSVNIIRSKSEQEFYNYDTVKYANLFNNSVGIRYSNITGFGLSLSTRFLTYYSIRVTGYIQYSEYVKWQDLSKTIELENKKDNIYDFGVELRGNIITTTKTNIFVLLGGYLSEDKKKDTYSEIFENKWVLGTGFGLDWFWSEHLAVDFNFGYKFDYVDGQEDGQPSLNKKTNVGFGVGFSYHF